MQSNQIAALGSSAVSNKKSSFSPRELIMYHIENPDEPITEEDIQNLNLKKYRVVDFFAEDFSRGED